MASDGYGFAAGRTEHVNTFKSTARRNNGDDQYKAANGEGSDGAAEEKHRGFVEGGDRERENGE